MSTPMFVDLHFSVAISQNSVLSLKDKESSRSAGVDSRQVKQAAFLQEVEAVAKEERVNHLRW